MKKFIVEFADGEKGIFNWTELRESFYLPPEVITDFWDYLTENPSEIYYLNDHQISTVRLYNGAN